MAKKKSKATRREEATAAERAARIRKEQEAKERRRQSLIIGAVVVVVLVIVAGIAIAIQSQRDTTGGTAGAPAGAVDQYAVPRGQESAPVTVTVYEDFLCPYCGQFESLSRDYLKQAAASKKVVVHYKVLDFLGEYSKRAANAFAVVLDKSGQDVAMKFHDLLYENQPEEGGSMPGNDFLVNLAVKAGAKESAVRPGIEDGAFDTWLQNGTDAASKAHVTSTPTVLIDGKKVNEQTIQGLVDAIKKAVG